jgi:hypothetical protein
MNSKRTTILVLLFSSTLTSSLWCQTDVGRITGTVSDASGAVIPGANVKVKDERTNKERIVSTSETGTFMVPQLQSSTYTLTASSTNFADAMVSGIALQVGQERTVNVILQAAAVATEVTVSSGGLANVDTDSARMGVNVTSREVHELPLNGRQISQLYLMAPGAVNSGGGNFDEIRFSGRANQQNAIRFDGVEGTSIIDASPGNLNGETSSPFRLQSSLENVQEFRVESNSYPAEYGTGTGGQVSIVTKSGGNAVHGSLFEYLRNDALDARNFFAQTADPLRLNQFGGSLGGALVKDKLFYFVSYEGLRQRQRQAFTEATLSATARARAVPSIQPVLGAFPIGQRPSVNPDFDIVSILGPTTVDENAGGLRLDYKASDKHSIYLRYFRDQGETRQTQNTSLSAFQVIAVPQNAVASWQWLMGPSSINELKFGFNGSKTRTNAIPPPVAGFDMSGVTLNITGQTALGGIGGQAGASGVVIPTGLVRASSATNGRGQPYTNYSMSFIDNFSMVRGNHNVKFGMEVRPIRVYTDRLGGTTYTFANLNDFLSNQPQQIQFLGDVSAQSPFTGLTGNRLGKQEYYIGYAQDEWKIRPNLTLNYGLRYEYYSPMREDRNGAILFNTVTGRLDLPGSRDFYQSSTNNFGPRLALTWSPEVFRGKTVFRAGSGIYYGPGQTEDLIQPIESDRVSRTISSGSLLSFPLNTAAALATYDIDSPTLGFQPRAYAPGYRVPERILSYTLSVQQQLPLDVVATVAYVGSQGRNLFLRSWSNKIVSVHPTPAVNAGTGAVTANVVREFGGRFAEVDYKTSGGTDHYDALQTALNRRFSQGLSLGAQYTWSHSIGDSSGSNEARTSQDPFNFAGDRGNNNFDVRQTFNLSALYELPFGRGRRYGSSVNGFADAVFGGWQLGGIVNARTGIPIEVSISRPDVVYKQLSTGRYYTSLNANSLPAGAPISDFQAVINTPGGGFSRNVRRPDVVPGVNPYVREGDRLFLNPAAFAVPQPGSYGNLSRNALAGPPLRQLDLTLSKRFRFSETANVEFRSEFYNVLNIANFANPPASLNPTLGTGLQPGQPLSFATGGNGAFGILNRTVSNQIGLGTNRQIQLALRFNF